MAAWVNGGVDAYVFTGERGAAPLPAASWQRARNAARVAMGLRQLTFTICATLEARWSATGASTRELMSRMGDSTPRAALIYQHATSERDQVIAAALSELATAPASIAARDGPRWTAGRTPRRLKQQALEREFGW